MEKSFLRLPIFFGYFRGRVFITQVSPDPRSPGVELRPRHKSASGLLTAPHAVGALACRHSGTFPSTFAGRISRFPGNPPVNDMM